MRITWTRGAELPPLAFTWRDAAGALIPFGSVAHTFTLKLAAGTTVYAPTPAFAGADTDPNLTMSFGTSDLDAVPAGSYLGQIWARRNDNSKDRLPLQFLFVLGA